MKLTKLSAAWLPEWTCRLMPAPARSDAGTASQLIPGVRPTGAPDGRETLGKWAREAELSGHVLMATEAWHASSAPDRRHGAAAILHWPRTAGDGSPALKAKPIFTGHGLPANEDGQVAGVEGEDLLGSSTLRTAPAQPAWPTVWRPNKGMKLTKLSAAPGRTERRLMPAPSPQHAGTALQLIPGVRRTGPSRRYTSSGWVAVHRLTSYGLTATESGRGFADYGSPVTYCRLRIAGPRG
jgi:hypothetical protein